MSEKQIENRLIREPAALGFPNAGIVRNARVSRATGRVDLMMLPRNGRKKLVLVEVKRAVSYDATSKVVGQLIMYYVASLQIGLRGLTRIRRVTFDGEPPGKLADTLRLLRKSHSLRIRVAIATRHGIHLSPAV
jgi:hypothetical protein